MKFDFPAYVADVLNTFKKANYEIYIVGGAVRDLLMGRAVHDWDFTTNATPEEILKLYPDAFYDNIFGTVGISQEDKSVLQITTYRGEEGYSDRRRPDKVIWGKTLEDDLARRDFTINAIALNIES